VFVHHTCEDTPVSPPNLSAFIRSVESELQARNAEFSLCDLTEYAQGVWPLAREEPDAGRWAAAFLEARGAASGH
jgi:hypothetical protein